MTKTARSVAALVGLVAVAACAESTIPTTGPQTTGVTALNTTGDLPPEVVTLCKVGPAGTTANFSITATGGQLLLGSNVTLNATALGDLTNCREVWRATSIEGDPVQTVTVTETGMTAGTYLVELVTISDLDGSANYYPPTNSASVRVNYGNGAVVFFKNAGSPSTGGSQGCTPGYWKQSQHFDSWTSPYTPTTAFGSVFTNAFPGKTLLDVLGQGGGGMKALGRHTVAALLNTASAGVDYGMTTADVINAFNTAVATGDIERQHNIFAEMNERGCPLN